MSSRRRLNPPTCSRVLSSLATVGAALVAPLSAAAEVEPPDYDFAWAVIGDVGNEAYDGRFAPYPASPFSGRGSVDYRYRISKLEITTKQWIEFLNVATPLVENPFFGRASSMGGFELFPNFFVYFPGLPQDVAERVPVLGITWREAALYCNWLHNGKERTLDALMHGAYNLDTLEREEGAKFWIPTVDEWLKAAHYDPDRYGSGQGGWWAYSTTSDTAPIAGPPGEGETSAGDFLPVVDEWYIPLGAYQATTSPWGLWDTSGGGAEWMEDAIKDSRYSDGSWAGSESTVAFGYDHIDIYLGGSLGFRYFETLRIASLIPCSGATSSIIVAAGWNLRRRRRESGEDQEDAAPCARVRSRA